MWARTTASLFFLERERAHVNLLGRPCSCFEKHICVYMYLPETSSRSAGLQSTIVFPFWKNLWKIGMKIKLCFNWAYVFWHEGCRLEGSLGWNGAKAETKLDHGDGQGDFWRAFVVPWWWKGSQLPGEVLAFMVWERKWKLPLISHVINSLTRLFVGNGRTNII